METDLAEAVLGDAGLGFRLPMRDGNPLPRRPRPAPCIGFRLPMRDGNSMTKTLSPGRSGVLDYL